VSLRYWLGKAVTLPPRTVARRSLEIIGREAGRHGRRVRDRVLPTYGARPSAASAPPPIFGPPPLEALLPRAGVIAALAGLHLGNRFDLLGSGWTEVAHGMLCRGLEGHRYETVPAPSDPLRLLNRANRGAARRLRALLPAGYRPIDWQLDFVSGHRWSERTWYREVAFGWPPGADVKLPWELSRMQHLPLLALAAALARGGAAGFRSPGDYAAGFRSHVLDFMAANPPRYGVAWACTMDVAIRAANWVTAHDLFRAAGGTFDAPFTAALLGSLEDHARFIAANLEWSVEVRSNHYLADVVGLLFAAAALPRSAQADAWLAFAVHELAVEVARQFLPDGASYEGSTSYHRLAAETALYGTALVLGLAPQRRVALREYDWRLAPAVPRLPPAPLPEHPLPGGRGSSPFPPEHFRRLELAAEFTLRLTDEAGLVPQVGDNDSGRFLRLCPGHRRTSPSAARARYANLETWSGLPDGAEYWDEEPCDHRHLPAATAGLIERPDFAGAEEGHPETAIVRALARCSVPAAAAEEALRCRIGDAAAWAARPAPGESVHAVTIDARGPDLRDGLVLCGYPDFGLWLFRSRRLYLAVRCGPVGLPGNGGHSHNDQLSFVLQVDGRHLVDDPGTYLYTPLPERRNEYRSVRAHAGPRTADGREPGSFSGGLFALGDEGAGTCLHFGEAGFLGTHRGFGPRVHRRVEIVPAAIVVTDWGDAALGLLAPLAPAGALPFSPGYGKREHAARTGREPA